MCSIACTDISMSINFISIIQVAMTVSDLGPFCPMLQQGDTQYMHFRPGDTGPFYGLDPPPNTSLKKMRELATLNLIPVEYEMKKTKEGWMGKPKGSLQILILRRSLRSSSSERSNWGYFLFVHQNTTLKLLAKASSMPGAAPRISIAACTRKGNSTPQRNHHHSYL